MVAHASPGSEVPTWACKAAIQSLAPMEPYRLFHKINEGVKKCHRELQASSQRLREAELVGSGGDDRISRRPAGLAQLGYACFWPNGGGEKENGSTKSPSPTTRATEAIVEQQQRQQRQQRQQQKKQKNQKEVQERDKDSGDLGAVAINRKGKAKRRLFRS